MGYRLYFISQGFTRTCKDCTALQVIDGLITTAATTLGECFHNCSSLVRINSALNVSGLTSQMDSTFTGCANLEVLEFTGTGVSKKITFGARNKAKLSAAQLALVTDKGLILG